MGGLVGEVAESLYGFGGAVVFGILIVLPADSWPVDCGGW